MLLFSHTSHRIHVGGGRRQNSLKLTTLSDLLQPHALSHGRQQVFSDDAKLKEGKQALLIQAEEADYETNYRSTRPGLSASCNPANSYSEESIHYVW